MGVYIKGMKMPTSCLNCPFSGFGGLKNDHVICMFTGSNAHINTVQYLDDCPLVSIPSYGRLINADELTALIYANIALLDSTPEKMSVEQKLVRTWLTNIVDDIEDAPTIIPAEEDE